jgi:hypothetical protein
MQRERVSSRSIASVGYDADAKTLEVEFHSGRLYQYIGVPPLVHDELVHADSIGAYFNANIRPIYPYLEVYVRSAGR